MLKKQNKNILIAWGGLSKLTNNEKTKKKTVIDESWFKRGNKVLIYGTRREDTFVAQNYKVETYYRCVGLIEGVNMDGSLEIRFTRNKKRM